MDERAKSADFSLLGGPLYQLGRQLRLVRNGTDTVALGLVLGAVPWVVLVVLAVVEGFSRALFSMEAIGAHVRLLVAIPLFFVCETLIDPEFAGFVRDIVRSEVVPPSARPLLDALIVRIARWRDSWLPEVALLLAAVLLGWATPQQNLLVYLPGYTAGSAAGVVSETTLTNHWYWMVCMTLFRFLFLRWLWRLALWCFFLWRVSRLNLRLVATHPDRAGGLGFLELVHTGFAPLIFAFAAVQSATLAQDIAWGRMVFDAIFPSIGLGLVVEVALFLAPLCIFAPKLRKCRINGIREYGTLGERYVKAFEKKWLGEGPAPQEPLLGSADIQSLADLSTSVDIIRDMRTVPVSLEMLIYMVGAALLPLLPLALFKYPLAALLEKFLEMLTGV